MASSLPARERGLKSPASCCPQPQCPVAPCAGAWIEIKGLAKYTKATNGRSLRGSVD